MKDNKVRRIVTGHTKEGKAIFINDQEFETQLIPTGDAKMSLMWTTAEVPADLNDDTEGREREADTTLRGGSVIRVVDMLPGATSPFHRSASIDYGIVLHGEIELELDNVVDRVIFVYRSSYCSKLQHDFILIIFQNSKTSFTISLLLSTVLCATLNEAF